MKKELIISIIFGVVFMLILAPFLTFSMYIPPIHSVIAIVLAVFSTVIFSAILYKIITKTVLQKSTWILVYFLILSGIAHGIYTVMFYSAWICLIMSAISFIALAICFLKRK